MENKETATQADHRASQSEEDKAARLHEERQRMADYRASESEERRAARLQQMRQYKADRRASQSEEERAARLQKMRKYMAHRRASESEERRAVRLQQKRQYNAAHHASQSEEKRAARLRQMRQYEADRRASESEERRAARLQKKRQYMADRRASQSQEKRAARLQQKRQYMVDLRASQSEEESAESRKLCRATTMGFSQTNNTFCDKMCEVCTKRCYPYQISKWTVNTKSAPYLPNELKQRNCLLVCHPCKNHLGSNKNIAPSKSYWNNLDPGPIPEYNAAHQASQSEEERVAPSQQKRQHMANRRASQSKKERATKKLPNNTKNYMIYQIKIKKIIINPHLIQKTESSAHELTTQKYCIAESDDMTIEDTSSCNAGLKITTTGTRAIMQENVKIEIEEEPLAECVDSLDIIYEPIVSEQIKKEVDNDHHFAEINEVYYSPAAIDKQEYSVTSTPMFTENEDMTPAIKRV